MPGKVFRVVRAVTLPDWLDGEPVPEFTPGMVVHEYKGVLYGSLMPGEIAVTFEPGLTPFYGIPADAVEDITDLVTVPAWMRDANRARVRRSLASKPPTP